MDNQKGADTFSPLAFPDGRIIYNFSLSENPPLSVECFPFELNREAQVVLYLADGSCLVPPDSQSQLQQGQGSDESSSEAHNGSQGAWGLDSLENEVRESRRQYRRAILHQLLLFDSVITAESSSAASDVLLVPPPEKSRSTTIKTVMCDITAHLLRSMDDLAYEIESFPIIEPPWSASYTKYLGTDVAARVHARMSTPGPAAQSSFEQAGPNGLSTGSSISRSATPVGGRSASRHSVASPNRSDRLSEVSTTFGSRDVSRDRNSLVSPPIASPTERKKHRSIARSRIVIGALYLQAGLWPDAIKDLSEGTAAARSNNDYVWHAKGLEYIISCLFMFGWAKMYFQIPHICYPITEKPSLSKSSSATPSSSTAELAPYGKSSSDSRTVSLHYLTKLLPDLLNSVSTLYTRASNFTQEALPQTLLSENIIRSGYLFSAMLLRNGIIDDEMLRALVSSEAIPKADAASRSTEAVSLRKSEIATMLLRAIPTVPEDVPLNELLHILVGLAATLSMIGMERKQAFILKDVLQRILPALIEARKVGAAEMGIHPAAGLLALSSGSHSGFLHIEEGMKSLLTFVAAMYGALDNVEDTTPASSQLDKHSAILNTSRSAQLHAYGSFDLKVDILKSCIAICEVLPDFEGVLRYTVDLLHLSRRVVMLPFHEPFGKPAISLEEQTKLMDRIKRTVGASRKVGMMDIQANYWDDFLVRGIKPLDPLPAYRVTPHSKKDLKSINDPKEGIGEDPFIYHPFSQRSSSETDQPLIADELAYFTVYLQNPFEVNVEIDEISLLTEGCDFQPSKHNIVLGYFCCQKFILAGTPRKSGTLRITGCRAKIRYCKERDFHIFSKDWAPKLDPKTKKIGHAALNVLRRRPQSVGAEPLQNPALKLKEGPESDTVLLNVLNPQPTLTIKSTTLSQPALMVLEGEKKSFEISLKNESKTTPVDLVLFTFQDSATTQLRAALMNKELVPTDHYELQLQLAGRAPFRQLANTKKDRVHIQAGETADFTIEVLGIPGLLNGIVQVDYANLGMDLSDVKDKFYTRQVSLPVAVTVNAGIEINRCNLLPFSGDFAWWNRQRASVASEQAGDTPGVLAPGMASCSTSYTPLQTDGSHFTSLLARLGLGSHGDDHCLLLLDLRNVWPFPLSVSVQVRENPNASSSPTDSWRRAYTVHESLQPGHVSRVVLLIPRVYVPEPHAPIPMIGNQRQFVVSASKMSVEAEQANREAFWYREELLKHIRGTWREDSTGREGTIDLRRGVRLNARMIDALKKEEVDISLSVYPSPQCDAQSRPSFQEGRSRFTIQTNSFATLITKVHNRSSNKLHGLLRVQPSLRYQAHNIALDLSKRFVWTGMLQSVLHPPLAPDEVRETSLGIMALCAGEYEIAASIEELKAPIQDSERTKIDITARSDDRRIWHATETCIIEATNHLHS